MVEEKWKEELIRLQGPSPLPTVPPMGGGRLDSGPWGPDSATVSLGHWVPIPVGLALSSSHGQGRSLMFKVLTRTGPVPGFGV